MIQKRHVLRAYDCVKLCHSVLTLCVKGALTPTTEVGALTQVTSAAEQLQSALEAQLIPESQFVPFEAPEEPVAEDGEAGHIFTQGDTPPLSDGYGPEGKSVQDPSQGPIILGDRASRQ